jgi:hypothetical protein
MTLPQVQSGRGAHRNIYDYIAFAHVRPVT